MLYYEIILIAIGLSMDSLAVSVTCGAVMKRCNIWNLIRIAGILAVFQASMTVIGFMAGIGFEQYINTYDHWIAFCLLLYLGGKMIVDSFKPNDEEEDNCQCQRISNRSACGMGLATSIDALAVGISLAILGTPLIPLTIVVGITTFLFAAFGIYFGCYAGRKMDIKLELIGGIILIAIGIKILVEHLFFS